MLENHAVKAAAHLKDGLTKLAKTLRLATLCLAFFFIIKPETSIAEPIDVISIPINNFGLTDAANNNGKLKFIGGLELHSTNEAFGGISGLRMINDGTQLLAVSDTARWFTASIIRDYTGKLKSLQKTDLGCVCQVGGKPYKNKRRGDSEALEVVGNRAYIAFERVNRINGYDLTNGRELGEPVQATASFDRFKLGTSQGLEALAIAPKNLSIAGSFIAFDENGLDPTRHQGFIATSKKVESFHISATGDYKVTDASFLPNGDLLVLERRIGLKVGVGMRIRQFDGNKIAAGKFLSGKTMLEAGLTNQIDNMEGISAWQNEAGETIITLISDDNFNRIQRTLLLEFKML